MMNTYVISNFMKLPDIMFSNQHATQNFMVALRTIDHEPLCNLNTGKCRTTEESACIHMHNLYFPIFCAECLATSKSMHPEVTDYESS